jgi:FkbM family methyltransferase
VIVRWVAETRAAAANPEHEWDRRALEWDLTPESVVVEVGGFKGRWALQIAERYAPRLYVFEPQAWAADVCATVLGERAAVRAYALGVESGAATLGGFGTDGATLLAPDGVAVEVREIGRAFEDEEIGAIDLMLMNVEGYEYTLIPHMLRRGIRPKALMVQFHTAYGDEGPVYAALRRARYRQAWAYGVILQAWVRK